METAAGVAEANEGAGSGFRTHLQRGGGLRVPCPFHYFDARTANLFAPSAYPFLVVHSSLLRALGP